MSAITCNQFLTLRQITSLHPWQQNRNTSINQTHNYRISYPLRGGTICAVYARKGDNLSPWDDKPYQVLLGEDRAYYDEEDVVAFIDPPKELIPLEPDTYNPAAYLWKKIGDIPEERRHRLLYLLNPRQISRVWEISGTRYGNSMLMKISVSSLLSDVNNKMSLEFWNCRTSGGPMPIGWKKFFNKAIFSCKDGQTYGRIIIGGLVPTAIANSLSPLYFTVRKQKEVMPTEQPCDFAYEFGDGLLDLDDYPQGFPKPVKHPWPFDDHVIMYVRHVGPGVLVGQAWQEGKALDQVPKKFCGEILMVKSY
ncbi:hypothetical protein GIB67_018665 [Kingdonia uniflora]|uniref:Uncharacterized protein n=1 Tax=Kingdonia uniflora TaxID=39325 RepID=A0A7J7M2K5_9MAGN|nr:hypothetical protein GIB67_018665 [Kingdonia uniflora]